ncbi:hypothetical protein FNYG_13571 [Fusarium nygamai]|uniref:Uncharacterized protein n=1 Tax=Gibberella nygamai TaxID=42673 RepID=A0A2K0UV74_GIBNY|nr:hypothetical protein FNYG_13571 [Fusarium nygamai]
MVAREQEAFIRKLREEAHPTADNRPKLRGRAAAKAKASREAEDAGAWEELRKSFLDPDTIEQQQRQLLRWEQADDEERSLMITTVPKSHLEAIPNIEEWFEENTYPFQDDDEGEASTSITVAVDFISVASTPKLPSLPASSEADDDEIDIITCSQVAATRGVTSNLATMPFGVDFDREEEAEPLMIAQNGWGYERPSNRYDDVDDEGYVEVGGVIVPAPRSRARTGRVRR